MRNKRWLIPVAAVAAAGTVSAGVLALGALPAAASTPQSTSTASPVCTSITGLTEQTLTGSTRTPGGPWPSVGDTSAYTASVVSGTGQQVGTLTGSTYVSYRNDEQGVTLQEIRQTIRLAQGSIVVTGLSDLSAADEDQWHEVTADGVSGAYRDTIGTLFYKVPTPGSATDASIYLCAGLPGWVPPTTGVTITKSATPSPPSTSDTVSDAQVATAAADDPDWGKPGHGRNDCVSIPDLTEQIVYSVGHAPGGTWPAIGDSVTYTDWQYNPVGTHVNTVQGHTEVPFFSKADDASLQYATETITLSDGVIKVAGLFNLTPDTIHDWVSMSAVGVSGRYRGMIGDRLFSLIQPTVDMYAAIYMCAAPGSAY